MITLTSNYFAFERLADDWTRRVDIYTFGERCEVVKCCTCTSIKEAILWANRKEARHAV